MKSLILSLFVMALSLSAFADASGSWNGWVYWTFQGVSTKCFSAVALNETAEGLHRKGGSVECEGAVMSMSEQMLSKVGSVLTSENTEVGSWTENNFKWTEKYSETVSIDNEITVKSNAMDYHERWYHPENGKEIYDIKGRMFKK